MRRALLAAAVSLLAVAASVHVASPASARVTCSQAIVVNVDGGALRYRVRVEQGRVTCASARRVLTRFMSTTERPAGWVCFRGHRSDAWAAACGSRRGVIIRAYALG